MSAWTRLLRLGVGTAATPLDVERIALTNGIAFLGLVLSLATLPLAIRDDNLVVAAMIPVLDLVCVAVLWLQAAGRTSLAPVLFVGATVLWVAGTQIFAGTLRSGGHMHLLELMLLPFLLFSARQARAAVVAALTAFGLYVALHFAGEDRGVLITRLRTADPGFLVNHTMVAAVLLLVCYLARRITRRPPHWQKPPEHCPLYGQCLLQRHPGYGPKSA